MYRLGVTTPEKEAPTVPKDCFAEKMRGWGWIFGGVVIVALLYAVLTTSGRDRGGVRAGQPALQVQTVAFRACPYCPGLLDVQGWCNFLGCPIYSPDWGRTVAAQAVARSSVLIKSLALEAAAPPRGGRVIIRAVYAGGNAELAGLRAGDTVLRVNGRRVKNLGHFQSLVAQAAPESSVRLEVLRRNKKIKAVVVVGEGEMEGVTVPTPVTPVGNTPLHQIF